MIDYTITVGNLLTIGGTIVAAIAAFLYQRFKIDTKADQKELDVLRLEITRDYVSAAKLKEVEIRLMASVDALASEIRGLRTDLLALYKEQTGRHS